MLEALRLPVGCGCMPLFVYLFFFERFLTNLYKIIIIIIIIIINLQDLQEYVHIQDNEGVDIYIVNLILLLVIDTIYIYIYI
jgi:Na+/alanine symporter